jgi:hypothetical protein
VAAEEKAIGLRPVRRAMSALFVFWKRARWRQLIKKECGKRKRDKVRGLDRRTGRN